MLILRYQCVDFRSLAGAYRELSHRHQDEWLQAMDAQSMATLLALFSIALPAIQTHMVI